MANLQDFVAGDAQSARFHPEHFRLAGYFGFWVMAAVSVLITKFVINPDMTQTPLVRTFGYNNICAYWDYTPAREVASVFWIFFEGPMAVYMFMSWLQLREAFDAGLVGRFHLYVRNAVLPLQLLVWLCGRLIFIFLVDGNMYGHSAGFICLQVALAGIALENCLFYNSVGIYTGAIRILNYIYVGLVFVVAVVLQVYILMVLINHVHVLSQPVAYGFDIASTLLNAVAPIFIGLYNIRHTPGLVATASLAKRDLKVLTPDGTSGEADTVP